MRRISLALALVGAVAATGCGQTSKPADAGSNRGVQDNSFKLTVRGEKRQDVGGTIYMLPEGGLVTGTGIRCGYETNGTPATTCEATIPYGTSVALTVASFNGSYAVYGYAGACSGIGTTAAPVACAPLMNADRLVLVRFALTQEGMASHGAFQDPAIHGPMASSFGLNCSSCHGATLGGAGLAPSCGGCHTATDKIVDTVLNKVEALGQSIGATGVQVTGLTLDTSVAPFTASFKLLDNAGKWVDVTGFNVGGNFSAHKNMPMAVTLGLVYFGSETDAVNGAQLKGFKSSTNGNPATTTAWATITNNTINPTTPASYPTASNTFTYPDGTIKQGTTSCTVAAPCTCSAATPCTYTGTVGFQANRVCTVASPCTCTSANPCGPALPATNAPTALTFNATTGVYTYTFASSVVLPADPVALPNGTLWIATARQENTGFAFDSQKFTALNEHLDFTVSGTGTPISRDIVNRANCAKCHDEFPAETNATNDGWGGFHSGARINGEYCNICHYDGRGAGRADGGAESRSFIHRIHAAEHFDAPKAAWYHSGTTGSVSGTAGIAVTYPQNPANCGECHAGAAQGDQYKTRPTITGCVGCHYNVYFTATAPTSAPAGAIAWVQHSGGVRADGSCSGCHSPTDIDDVHVQGRIAAKDPNNYYAWPVVNDGSTKGKYFTQGTGASLVYCTDTALCTCTVAAPCTDTRANTNTNAGPEASTGVVVPGAAVVAWDIKEVGRDASKHPWMTFRILVDGSPATLNTTGDLITNFAGAPSIYWVWAAPQDGIAAPADFNVSSSKWLKDVIQSPGTAFTVSAADAQGYITVTSNSVVVSDASVMLTGGIGYTYNLSTAQPLTQTNLAAYPYGADKQGGLVTTVPNASKVATDYTGRRVIVSNARCNNCHSQLGVGPTFHAGQRNDAPTCSWCHTVNRTGATGWAANAKDFIHGIHGAKARTKPYTWHATCAPGTKFAAGVANTVDVPANPNGACVDVNDGTTQVPASAYFAEVEFPGRACLDCHEPGTFDMSATAAFRSAMLPSGVASGTAAASIANAPDITVGANYGTGWSYAAATGVVTPASGATLVSSPVAAACTACHDSASTKAHIQGEGGVVYTARSALTFPLPVENCFNCHGAGKIGDVGRIH